MILISNDDGPASPGLHSLIRELSDLDEVSFSIPEGQRSAASMSLTFHKPLRVKRVKIRGISGYAVSGSPADAVSIALLKLFDERPRVLVSGINIGDNTGVQDIFASGTVAATIQAAIMGVPAVAFSMEIGEQFVFSAGGARGNFARAATVAKTIVKYVMDEGLPKDVQFLNVNFPSEINDETEVLITWPATTKYDNYVVKRIDPRGKPYYWLWGKRLDRYPEGSDAHALFDLRAISITPMKVDLSVRNVDLLNLVRAIRP